MRTVAAQLASPAPATGTTTVVATIFMAAVLFAAALGVSSAPAQASAHTGHETPHATSADR